MWENAVSADSAHKTFDMLGHRVYILLVFVRTGLVGLSLPVKINTQGSTFADGERGETTTK